MILDSYARESKKGDRNVSVPGQHAANIRRISNLGAELGQQLDDRGKSAWLAGVQREGWDNVCARLGDESDGVVIFDMERFIRRVKGAVGIVDLAEQGERQGFMLYDSDQTYDLSTASGRSAFYEHAKAAEYYSHRISERVRRGNASKVGRGEGRSGRYRGLGFDPVVRTDENGEPFTTIEVNEEERPIIREAVRRFLDGVTWKDVCAYVNTEGLRTGAGNIWTPVPLRNTLKSPRMAGYIKVKGELMGELPGEPLIDRADWQELLMKIASRRGRPPEGKFLGGGIYRCGQCGGRAHGRRSPHGALYSDGTTRGEYVCRMDEGACGRSLCDVRMIDDIARRVTVGRLSDEGNAQQIRSRAVAEKEARKPHVAELARLAELREHWDAKLMDNAITVTRYDKLMAELDGRAREAEAAVEAIGETRVPPEEVLKGAAAQWEEADVAGRRTLLRMALEGHWLEIDPGTTSPDVVPSWRIKPV